MLSQCAIPVAIQTCARFLRVVTKVKPGVHGQVFFDKIICHRNFGNEFAFTHSKDYLYYLARSSLSQIFDNETSPQN